MISDKQIKMLQTLYHRLVMDEDTRRNMLHELTNGRTTSTKELTALEAKSLIMKLVKQQDGDFVKSVIKKNPPCEVKCPSPDLPDINEQEVQYESRKLCGAIYRLSLEIPFLNKGYDSTDYDEIQMNYAKVGKWCREKTIYKKNLTQMNIDELKGVKKQLEAIAAKERKRVPVTEKQ